ncbi:MAG: ABC transporter ATP-binding protein [Bowdeniella nasicola]|nr:ABC transporter ATP-binding protein [Bowdeniella nasicola]
MWKLFGDIVGVRELGSLTGVFIITAIIEGVTLVLLYPFLRAFLSGDPHTWYWLLAVIIMALATFGTGVYAQVRSYRISVYEVCDRLIERIATHVLQLPLGWHTAARQGAFASAVSREINTLSHIASIVIPNIVTAFGIPLVMTVALFFFHWQLAAIILVAIPPLIVVWRWMRRRSIAAHAMETRAAQVAAGRLIEYAQLQPILRATGHSERAWEPLERALSDEDIATRASLRSKRRPVQVYTFILIVVFAALIGLGAHFVLTDALDPIAYLAMMVIATRMFDPLTKTVLYATEMHNSLVALRAIHAILSADLLPEVTGDQAVTTLEDTDITFENVTFGYQAGNPVLADISFRADTGTMTALVGPSGSGKSTILRLLARFWDVDEGAVRIGGVDVRDIPTAVLMRHISMVFQDVYLFDTTIAENVRMANPEASDAELIAAARAARLDDVIDRLPDGWDTRVGQGGLKLSGGERQRVSIARAFLKNAPILLLDEITSALDGENEAAITAVMRELTNNRTVIVVAHRLSTIRDADQVIVLQHEVGAPGTIAQRGAPATLAAQAGPYRQFVDASSAAHRRLI